MTVQTDIGKILFLDIETVSGVKHYSELDETFRQLWAGKSKSFLKKADDVPTDDEIADAYEEKAAIFAEFGKIICISVAIAYKNKENELRVRLKSFADHDESVVIKEFFELVTTRFNDPPRTFFCGHNIKEFDIPYICRRAIINAIPLPSSLDVSGKKPWETVHFLDTMEMWKFGDKKNYTSLKLLAGVLGFPSPKDDIDGSEVGRVYWQENDLDRIARYCEKDVLATIQLYLRLNLLPLLKEEQVEHRQ